MIPSDRKTLGSGGEVLAVAYLRQQGIKILEQNFRCRWGEMDIIGFDRNTVCFVEVKTRRSLALGTPAEAVGKRKQKTMIKTATWFLKIKGWSEKVVRFDVIAIRLSKNEPAIEYFKNAFDAF